ncbi:Snm1p NDAI_0H00930 [Naumovozyma dairenensis CBS 421]|uniref:Uncharacterized protein n=1 Tax=Naumovozyma dairenensis (strain ATCC 10597 / BCRC 20456 / CBS 421 / NBRC 0211 / NRRL Y-12639) TaxID=1071378 RepID=G0WEQ6_NAUDC|nr:hypothetical protein NDAI_0H00930 [Naumovozyma dairenensis CBS 421]CCD26267.1 hypothetical protein NDAI_0H00930 [Naumovozyma dairenensis CBS 421]
MNRDQAEKFKDRHIRQKYDLLHLLPSMLPTGNPALSGLYLKSFYNGVKRYKLQLPSSITNSNEKFCGSCGTVRIINRNLEMEMVVREKMQENDDSSSQIKVLKYKCLNCNFENEFTVGNVSHRNKEIANPKIPRDNKDRSTVKLEAKNTNSTNGGIQKKNTAKDRAKKRKMNSLSNLLSKKNQEKSKQKSTSLSLSLESFMNS